MNESRRTRRWRVAAAVAALAVSQVALQLGAAPSASASAEKITAVSATNSVSPKVVTAHCPEGESIIGGGGTAAPSTFAGLSALMLTGLVPFHNSDGDGFTAVAFERQPGLADNWSLYAYALCGTPVNPVEIVSATTDPSSARFTATAAACPSGKRVLSTGALVNFTNGAVGLQLNRSDGPLTISRATAREDAAGYDGYWSLTSYAVCVRPIGQINRGTVVFDSAVGNFTCPLTPVPRHGYVPTFVTGVNGGAGLTDGAGAVFLRVVYPADNLRDVTVAMTGIPANGMAVGAICVP